MSKEQKIDRKIEDHEIWDEFWDSGFRTGSAVRECKHGITFFNSHDRGCFDEGELEDLLKKAQEKPDQYVDTEGIHFTEFCDIEWCWSCNKCRTEALKYQTIIWEGRQEISRFINARLKFEFEQIRKDLVEMQVKDDPKTWREIESAPKNATNVQVITKSGKHYPCAHYAEDLSGEEQPAFQGWFVPVKDSKGKIISMDQIETPVYWKPINDRT